MLLKEYYQIKSDVNYKNLSLNSDEIRSFRIPDLKRGWAKRTENYDIPDSVILKTIDKVLLNPKVKTSVKSKLKRARGTIAKDFLVEADNNLIPDIGYEYLYIIKNELGMIKIGVSKTPQLRARNITTSSGLKCELVAYYKGSVPSREVERIILERFIEHKAKGEWFKPNTVTRLMIESILPVSYVAL